LTALTGSNRVNRGGRWNNNWPDNANNNIGFRPVSNCYCQKNIVYGLYSRAIRQCQAVHPAPVSGRTNRYKLTASGRPIGSKDAVSIYGEHAGKFNIAGLFCFKEILRREGLTGIEEGEVFRGNGGRRGDVVIEKRNDC